MREPKSGCRGFTLLAFSAATVLAAIGCSDSPPLDRSAPMPPAEDPATDSPPTADHAPPGSGNTPAPAPPVGASPDPTIVLESAPGSSGAERLGVAGGYAYWTFWNDGTGIAAGSVTGGPTAVLEAPSRAVGAFSVGTHLAYRSPSGVRVVLAGTTTPLTVSHSEPMCDALATSDGHLYCRRADAIVAWSLDALSSEPETIATGVPAGHILVARNGELYFEVNDTKANPDTGAIFSVSAGGDSAPKLVVSGIGAVRDLVVTATRMAWFALSVYQPGPMEKGGASTWTTSQLLGTGPHTQQDLGSAHLLAVPSTFEDTVVLADAWSLHAKIMMHRASGTPQGLPAQNAPEYISGLAADATHVYWLSGDGRVRRVARP